MKINMELDDEQLDEVFRQNLAWHITHIRKDLMYLRGKKILQRHEKEDKEYFERLYPALKIVGDYFGVKNESIHNAYKKSNRRVY